MSDFDSLREDFARAFDAIRSHAEAQGRYNEATAEEVARLWLDNAALRDDLHALANRVETLTRAVSAEPHEVADSILRAQQWAGPNA